MAYGHSVAGLLFERTDKSFLCSSFRGGEEVFSYDSMRFSDGIKEFNLLVAVYWISRF